MIRVLESGIVEMIEESTLGSTTFDRHEDIIPPRVIVRLVPLERFSLDEEIRSRVDLDQTSIDHYADILRENDFRSGSDSGEDGHLFDLPPAVAFEDGATLWLASGYLRYHAYRAAGRSVMPCQVRFGSWRDARLFAASCNHRHGFPRTNADIGKAVMTLLNDPEWSQWENARIARHCGVHRNTVLRYRNRLEGDDCQDEMEGGADADAKVETEEVSLDGVQAEQTETGQSQGTPASSAPANGSARSSGASRRASSGRVRSPHHRNGHLGKSPVSDSTPTNGTPPEVGSLPTGLEEEIREAVYRLYHLLQAAELDLQEVLTRYPPPKE